MNMVTAFLRDTRGVALADYAAVAALVALLRELTLRHAVLNGVLHSLFG